MNGLLRDVATSVRGLMRSPLFAMVAVSVLAIGIAFDLIVIAIINGALMRPSLVQRAGDLSFIYPSASGATTLCNLAEYEALIANDRLFVSAAAIRGDITRTKRGDDAIEVSGEVVTPSYFGMLGVQMFKGRDFAETDNDPKNPPTIIISYDLWRRHFDPQVAPIGQYLALSRASADVVNYMVIGVAPEGFRGLLDAWNDTDYWIVPAQRPDFGIRFESVADLVVVRRQDGVAGETVRAVADSWFSTTVRGSRQRQSQRLRVTSSQHVRLPFAPQKPVSPTTLGAGLFAVTNLVLLLAMANLVGLLVTRSISRRREIAVRLFLGAKRWQIWRQLTVESMILALIAGAVAVPAAILIANAILGSVSASAPGLGRSVIAAASADRRLLLFAIALCAVIGLVIGLIQSHSLLSRRNGVALSGAVTLLRPVRRAALRHYLLMPHMGLVTALLIAAGAYAKELIAIGAVAPGYDAARVVFLRVDLPLWPAMRSGVPADAAAFRDARARYLRRLLEAIGRSPVIASAALADGTPLGAFSMLASTRDGMGAVGTPQKVASIRVSGDYFASLSIPVLEGRTFARPEEAQSANVAIVDQAVARSLWGSENAIGKPIALVPQSPAGSPPGPPTDWLEVVGVVGAIKGPLSEGAPTMSIYVPGIGAAVDTVLARSNGTTQAAILEMREAVKRLDSTVGVLQTGTLADQVNARRASRKTASWFLATAAIVGFGLSIIGIWGVMSQSVALRVEEFGIRLALGATSRSMITLLMKETALVASVGTVLGTFLGFGLIRVVSSLLVPIHLVGASIVVATAVTLNATLFLACYFPGRRAAQLDPSVSLRQG